MHSMSYTYTQLKKELQYQRGDYMKLLLKQRDYVIFQRGEYLKVIGRYSMLLCHCVILDIHIHTAEERATEAEGGLMEYEEHLQQLETQWVVRRAEIQLTGPELGRGGWATVSVATFRRAKVAAKSIHHQIVSPHNLQMFQREMNMAARLHHPNLASPVHRCHHRRRDDDLDRAHAHQSEEAAAK